MNRDDELLKRGFEELGIIADEPQIRTFIVYLEELRKWNEVHNLTGLKEKRQIIIKHFLDSLLFLKVLPDHVMTVADIGTGAGFPGIPMNIIRPQLKLFLIEPSQKKAIFLRHITHKLGLNKVTVVEQRIEEINNLKVDAVVTRALFSIGDLIEKARAVLKESGVVILSKGPKLEEEIKKTTSQNISIVDLKLPFENVMRHLVIARINNV